MTSVFTINYLHMLSLKQRTTLVTVYKAPYDYHSVLYTSLLIVTTHLFNYTILLYEQLIIILY